MGELRVTNIERFATHDGPGIRTTVFLKGCPLHCPWCANPETQSAVPELMHDRRRCVGCGLCAAACARGAIKVTGGVFSYERAKCAHCFKCEEACLADALSFSGKKMSVEEVLAEVMKDRDYYEASGGGLTVSGGEPFMHAERLVTLLREAKRLGLDTAAETTGNYSLSRLKAMEKYLDHFLYDFKHLDDARLHEVTGADGELVKGNLRYLLSHAPEKVTVRMPIIPGFNFERGLLLQTLDFLRGLGAQRVDLLPYHTLGRAKYEKLGWEYMAPEKMLAEEELEEYREYAQSLGMEARIGA